MPRRNSAEQANEPASASSASGAPTKPISAPATVGPLSIDVELLSSSLEFASVKSEASRISGM